MGITRTDWIYNAHLKNIDGPILDAGCNEGELCRKAPEKFVGIDNGENLKKLSGLNVRFADLNEKLPFDSDSFSAVCCTETLEHLSDPTSTVKEFCRVLKPNGLLLISVPCYKYHLAYHFTHKRFFHGKRDMEIIAKWTGLKLEEAFEVRGIPTFINIMGERLGLLTAKLLPKIGFHGIVYAKFRKQ